MSILNRGDRVQVVATTEHKGKLGTVTGGGDHGAIVVLDGGESIGMVPVVDLVLVAEPQPDPADEPRYEVGQRVTVNARPDVLGNARRFNGESGAISTVVGTKVTVVLDMNHGASHTFDPADLIPEDAPLSKRDEYAAEAEQMLDDANRKLNEGYMEAAAHYGNAALVFATLAVAYGQEQGR